MLNQHVIDWMQQRTPDSERYCVMVAYRFIARQ